MKQTNGTYTSVGIAALYFADQTQQAGSEEQSKIHVVNIQ
jgi:hypothetical protein